MRRFALALLVCAAATLARADDRNLISINTVPANVRQAAGQIVPGAQWFLAFEGKLGDQGYYQLAGSDQSNRRVFLQVFADGRVLDLRTTIPLDQAPQAVAQALAREKPDFTASELQYVVGYRPDNGERIDYYRFVGKTGQGGEIAMVVGTDGQKVFQESSG